MWPGKEDIVRSCLLKIIGQLCRNTAADYVEGLSLLVKKPKAVKTTLQHHIERQLCIDTQQTSRSQGIEGISEQAVFPASAVGVEQNIQRFPKRGYPVMNVNGLHQLAREFDRYRTKPVAQTHRQIHHGDSCLVIALER